jgi:ABC-type nitrate/sulfonate/bicarbonate transport system substrate-binding protein
MMYQKAVRVFGESMRHSDPQRRVFLRTFAAGGVAVVLAGSVPSRSVLAQNSGKIKVARVPVNALPSWYIGEVDFFRDEGVPIESIRFDNAGQIFQAMAGGDLVAAEIGLAPTIIALTRGLPFVAPFLGACSVPGHPYERIMVLPESSIQTIDDLKGKRLGYQGPGTVPDMLLGALPLKSKISKEDIQLVPLPPPTQPDALGQGLVDAIFAIPPADTVAERKYKARTIADATQLVPYSGLSTFVFRRDYADKDPETVTKLLSGSIRFLRWITDNPAPARSAMGKNLGLPDDLAAQARLPLFTRNGFPIMPNVWHVYQMLIEAKTIDPHPDPAKLFNDAIVEPTKRFTLPAVEKLGMQPDPEIEKMLTGEYPLLPKPVASYYADWERRLLKL